MRPSCISTSEQQRGADHDRHLLTDELHVDDQRHDEGAEAEDEQDVEDIAADYVADRDVGLPFSTAEETADLWRRPIATMVSRTTSGEIE